MNARATGAKRALRLTVAQVVAHAQALCDAEVSHCASICRHVRSGNGLYSLGSALAALSIARAAVADKAYALASLLDGDDIAVPAIEAARDAAKRAIEGYNNEVFAHFLGLCDVGAAPLPGVAAGHAGAGAAGAGAAVGAIHDGSVVQGVALCHENVAG